MNKITAHPLLSLGVALGASAIAVLPAIASTTIPSYPTSAALLDMLAGNATTPGGVISIPTGGQTVLPGFNFSPPNPFSTSLTVKFGSDTVVFSSLTKADWDSDVDNNGKTLTEDWLYQALTNNGLTPTPSQFTALLNAFIANKGREFVSDPKIAYLSSTVNGGGNINVGLAGFLNASDLLAAAVKDTPFENLVPPSVKASELAKVVVNGGTPKYLYGFTGTNSGQSLLGTDFNTVCTGGAAGNPFTDPKAECPFTANYQVTLGGLTAGSVLASPSLAWVNPASFPPAEPIYSLSCSNGAGTVSPTFTPCNTNDYNNAINIGSTPDNPLQPTPDPANPDSSVYPDLPIGDGGLGTDEFLWIGGTPGSTPNAPTPAAFGAQPLSVSPLDGDIGGSLPTRAAFGAEPFGVSPLDGGISALGTSVVTGYAYSVTGGPKFRAVRVNQSALPYPATQLTLELPGFANQTLVLGTTFNLLNVNPAGFSNFNITGIDPAAGILPTDPPLLTGLLFTGSGTATIIQTPIVTQIATVPEPSNLFALGLLGFGALLQRQLNKQKQAKKDPQEK